MLTYWEQTPTTVKRAEAAVMTPGTIRTTTSRVSMDRVTTLQTLWKFPDNSLTMCGTHAHVKWYS